MGEVESDTTVSALKNKIHESHKLEEGNAVSLVFDDVKLDADEATLAEVGINLGAKITFIEVEVWCAGRKFSWNSKDEYYNTSNWELILQKNTEFIYKQSFY